MATSGSFNTTAINVGSGKTRYLTFSWSRSSTNISGNSSTISWSLKGAGTYGSDTSAYWTYVKNVTLTINGTTYAYCSSETKVYTGTIIGSGTLTIPHNSDGTKSFSVSCSAGIYSSYSPNSSGTATFTLDTIARATTSCSASDVTSGGKCAIKWTPLNSSFKYRIKFVLGSVSYTTDDITPGSTSEYTYTGYTMTASTWGPAIPSSADGSVSTTLYTYNGSTLLGFCTASFKFTLASTVIPSISSVTTSNTISPTTYGYLQNYSKVKVVTSASGINGSTINSYAVSVNGQNLSGSTVTSDVLKTSGDNTISVTVKDSRGRSATKTASITVVKYSTPKINSFSASRCNSSGTTSNDGLYLHVTGSTTHTVLSGATHGTTVNYKKSSASTWAALISRNTTASYTLPSTTVANAESESSYDVQITVSDGVQSVTQTQSIPTVFVLMDFYKDGNGLAIGKVAESASLFDVNLSSKFRNRMILKAPIAYEGTKSTDNLIKFIDNTQDGYGNGIAVGGGGTVIVGAGESTTPVTNNITNGGEETLYLASDEGIVFLPGQQNGYTTAYRSYFGSNGTLNGIRSEFSEYHAAFYMYTNYLQNRTSPSTGGSSWGQRIYILPQSTYSNINAGETGNSYFRALLKWICANYPGLTSSIWIGRGNPDAAGTVIINIYDTSKLSSGLPQYSSGMYIGYGRSVRVFGTQEYAFHIDALNAESLATAQTVSYGGGCDGLYAGTWWSTTATNMNSSGYGNYNAYVVIYNNYSSSIALSIVIPKSAIAESSGANTFGIGGDTNYGSFKLYHSGSALYCQAVTRSGSNVNIRNIIGIR